jgi:hypothetical protein
LVLNWVATTLEFDKLITCFGAPVDKMVSAIGEQAVVCKERMDLQQAKMTMGELLAGADHPQGDLHGTWQQGLHDGTRAHGLFANLGCQVAEGPHGAPHNHHL